jgi:hypothetical protein
MIQAAKPRKVDPNRLRAAAVGTAGNNRFRVFKKIIDMIISRKDN